MAQTIGVADLDEEQPCIGFRVAPLAAERSEHRMTTFGATVPVLLAIVLLIGVALQLQHLESVIGAASSSGGLEQKPHHGMPINANKAMFDCYADVDKEQQELFKRSDFMANQGFEIAFHLKNKWRASSSFLVSSEKIFREAGFSLNEFAGKIVVDIGAGSRMRAAVLKGAKIVAVEPMGHQLLHYLATHPNQNNLTHMDFYKPDVVWQLRAAPAEQRLCSIEGQAELVMSINVIDHAYSWQTILRNMALAVKFCRPDTKTCGRMFITVDLNHRPHEGHPFTLTKEGMETEYRKNGFRVAKYYEQGSHAAGYAQEGGPAVVTGCWVLVRSCCNLPGF